MKLGRLLAATVVCGLIASPSAHAAAITIDNFELPEVNGPGTGVAPGYEYRLTGDAGWGWISGGGNVVQFEVPPYQVGGTLQTVFDGDQAVQLEVTGTFIERSIATISGQLYALTFQLASFVEPGQSTANSFLGVSINGGALVPFLGTEAWTLQTLPFVATGASTTIHFENRDPLPNPPYTYPHLDAIAYEAVPEPTSLVLLGAGMLGLASRARSRRSKK